MDFHRPCFCAHLEIAGLQNEVIPVCPCRSSEKKQREHGVEKKSLETLQSNWVHSGVSHDELNLQDGAALRSNISASARYCLNKLAACSRRANTIFVSASASMHSEAATLTLINSQADRPVHPSSNGLTYCPRCLRRAKYTPEVAIARSQRRTAPVANAGLAGCRT